MKFGKYLKPEDVIPGMIGVDYNNEPATVILIKQINKITQQDLKELAGYDDAGWFSSDLDNFLNNDLEENFLEKDDWLVAVEDERGSSAVFQYDGTGFLVPETERWKISDKLRKNNQLTGVLENVRRIKTFKDF